MCVGDLASEPPSKRSKTHRHSYRYDPTTRAQIGEYTYNNGPAAAVRHFSMLLGYRIPESTTRKFRDAYVTELKKQRNSDSSDSLEYLRDSTDIFVNGFKAAWIWDILNMH